MTILVWLAFLLSTVLGVALLPAMLLGLLVAVGVTTQVTGPSS